MELPRFDCTNPHLWQTRCEDYFQLWGTPMALWIPYASAQFVDAAARWLESFQRRFPRATWPEFCQVLLARFSRNQHQNLIRQLFHISQTSTVLDYVDRFSELYDQLPAYENIPDPLHYLTRFLDGLHLPVRMAVSLQKPHDLDAPYELAILHEELAGTSSSPPTLDSTPSH